MLLQQWDAIFVDLIVSDGPSQKIHNETPMLQ